MICLLFSFHGQKFTGVSPSHVNPPFPDEDGVGSRCLTSPRSHNVPLALAASPSHLPPYPRTAPLTLALALTVSPSQPHPHPHSLALALAPSPSPSQLRPRRRSLAVAVLPSPSQSRPRSASPSQTPLQFEFYLSDSESKLLLTDTEGYHATQAAAAKLCLAQATASLPGRSVSRSSSTAEVDKVLWSHPEVTQALAFGVPDDKYGEELLVHAVNDNLILFSYNEMLVATRNFWRDKILGQGGFGVVYKWVIDENVRPGFASIQVAVKQLNLDGLQGHRERRGNEATTQLLFSFSLSQDLFLDTPVSHLPAPASEGNVRQEEEAAVAFALPAPPPMSEDLRAVMEQVEKAFQGEEFISVDNGSPSKGEIMDILSKVGNYMEAQASETARLISVSGEGVKKGFKSTLLLVKR
ncbi:hypothetical protein Taro_031109, partial [Colocasia esculenta]|nr:hypothetical protein [Colocasia esculenta]